MFVPRHSAGFVIAVSVGICIIAGSVDARAPSKIIGGSDAQPGEFPWQASVRAYGSHLCGGTIIGKRHILTAAHCIVGISESPYDEITVVTGSHTLQPGTGTTYRVKDIIIHKEFSTRTSRRKVQNDIAVITLEDDIEENDHQKSIALPTEDVPNGDQGIVTGFGRVDSGKKQSSNVLQKLGVILMSDGNCFGRGVRIQPTQLCGFKVTGYGTCKGDSGSPLVYNGAVAGIVSTSMTECGSGIPDVYTRVYHYVDFIKEAMETP